MASKEVSLDTVYPIIGQVCVLWAEIDFHLMNLAYLLAQYHSNSYISDDISIPFDTLLRNTDMRCRADTVLSLSLSVKEDPEFFSDTKKVIDNICSDLRIKRNRLVHDDWVPGEGEITQIHYYAKVKRPQAHNFEVKLRTEVTYTELSELQSVAAEFIAAAEAISEIRGRLLDILRQR